MSNIRVFLLFAGYFTHTVTNIYCILFGIVSRTSSYKHYKLKPNHQSLFLWLTIMDFIFSKFVIASTWCFLISVRFFKVDEKMGWNRKILELNTSKYQCSTVQVVTLRSLLSIRIKYFWVVWGRNGKYLEGFQKRNSSRKSLDESAKDRN